MWRRLKRFQIVTVVVFAIVVVVSLGLIVFALNNMTPAAD